MFSDNLKHELKRLIDATSLNDVVQTFAHVCYDYGKEGELLGFYIETGWAQWDADLSLDLIRRGPAA